MYGARSVGSIRTPEPPAYASSATMGSGAISRAGPSGISPNVALTTTVAWSAPPRRHSVHPHDTGLSAMIWTGSDDPTPPT